LFHHGARSAFNQFLGFFEAEVGQSTDNLDDVNLVRADFFEDNIEFGLFFFFLFNGGGNRARLHHHRAANSSFNAELFFESFLEVLRLEKGQAANLFHEALNVSHDKFLS
jgi:hypothetical protein